MKRNMDLVRQILLMVEEEDGYPNDCPSIDGVDENVIHYHCTILHEAGLIEAMDASNNMQPWYFIPTRLTWAGHEFLDAARSDTIWRSAKTRVAKVGESVSMETMLLLLRKLGNVALGLESD
jgi:hypothetical protein